jgi:hypothetical protein
VSMLVKERELRRAMRRYEFNFLPDLEVTCSRKFLSDTPVKVPLYRHANRNL